MNDIEFYFNIYFKHNDFNPDTQYYLSKGYIYNYKTMQRIQIYYEISNKNDILPKKYVKLVSKLRKVE